MEQSSEQVAPVVPSTPATPHGVGGWLLFFALVTLIFAPLFQSYVIWKEAAVLRPLQGPAFSVFAIDASMRVVVISLAIYAGISLLRKRRNAPRHAKTYLVAVFVQQLVLVAVGAWIEVHTNDFNAIEAITLEAFRSCVYVIVWYSYFEKSRRVAATFPSGTV
jgi:hypothetical protein